MKDQQLKMLKEKIGSDKTYLKDGYYRIRETGSGQHEIAFLKPEGCATTSVNPQITLEKVNGEWLGVKLIDMGTSPTRFLKRDEGVGEVIDCELELLVKKMLNAIAS